MLVFSIIKYFHFISIFVIFAALIAQVVMLQEKMPKKSVGIIQIVNLFLGISVVIILITGILLLFYSGKPIRIYMINPIFHLKITLFFIIALLSIFHTIMILKLRKIKDDIILISKHKTISIFLKLELSIFLIIPLLAVLMTNGIGL